MMSQRIAMPKTEAELRDLDQVEVLLQTQFNGRVHYLHLVLVDDGIVLRGLARTFYVKQLAQHAVMSLTHLPIVANEIEVA